MGYTYHRKRESINVPNVTVLKPGGGYSGDHRKSTSPNTWQFSLKKKKERKKERKWWVRVRIQALESNLQSSLIQVIS